MKLVEWKFHVYLMESQVAFDRVGGEEDFAVAGQYQQESIQRLDEIKDGINQTAQDSIVIVYCVAKIMRNAFAYETAAPRLVVGPLRRRIQQTTWQSASFAEPDYYPIHNSDERICFRSAKCPWAVLQRKKPPPGGSILCVQPQKSEHRVKEEEEERGTTTLYCI